MFSDGWNESYKCFKTFLYSHRKTKRVVKSPAFLFSIAIWSYLAYSWSVLNYMCKAKYTTLGNG